MIDLTKVLKQIQANILLSSTNAGSGHPSSSLSPAHIITAIFFTKMRFDLNNPDNIDNDRLIFSKGHATSLYYSLYKACGYITQDELMTYRKFGSRLEGHSSVRFPFTEVMTGSLGQGLGVSVGEAVALKKQGSLAKIYCLVGDGELAEGSIYEGFSSASYYNLDNLITIIDLNKLGQSGITQLAHDTTTLKKRLESFGQEVFVIENANNMDECLNCLHLVTYDSSKKPKVIIAKTLKGAGVSFLSNREGYHGKVLTKDQCREALKELGEVDMKFCHPINSIPTVKTIQKPKISSELEIVKGQSTRQAYANTLKQIVGQNPQVIVLDAEVSNSTYVDTIAKDYPNNFLEMFIAEQNMISVATGLSKVGFVPFCSAFGAFLSRAYDQIRMTQYADTIINIAGSHCGVSIGADGPSQMALEDIAIFRAITDSWVLYPCDSISTANLVGLMSRREKGLNYLRLTRDNLGDIYNENSQFLIGGSNVLTDWSSIAILACGVTIPEAIKASKIMPMTVVDMYSIKPIDTARIEEICRKCKLIITIEDHHKEGGLYDSVLATGKVNIPIYQLAVTNMPQSGTKEELLKHCKIDKDSILELLTQIV